jgi:SAM-dependent methyltransferase
VPIDLKATFGAIDIYLFDQLLRGQIRPGHRVVDAGCGFGRNLVFLLRSGVDVLAVDADADAVREVRQLAAELAPQLSPENFRAEPIERCSFPDGVADVAISSAVLHFARDEPHFEAMLRGTWRLVGPGGLMFCRLASSIGIEASVEAIDARARRFRLPDGSDRFLVDQPYLLEWTRRLGGHLVDPLKTTVVQDRRAMTTWVVRRNVEC